MNNDICVIVWIRRILTAAAILVPSLLFLKGVTAYTLLLWLFLAPASFFVGCGGVLLCSCPSCKELVFVKWSVVKGPLGGEFVSWTLNPFAVACLHCESELKCRQEKK
jgi:hypothetical protein